MKKIEHIKNLLNQISEERKEQIKMEVQKKESYLLTVAQNGSQLDETHRDMVLESIRDNKPRPRPESLNKLMVQLVSSAFSYNRIRKQLRKINREVFKNPSFPVRENHEQILAYILNDKRLEDEVYWHPREFKELLKEIDKKGDYKHLNIISDYWLEHMMDTLRTAPTKLMELSNSDINKFYKKVDTVCNQQFGRDVFIKAQELWEFATEMSKGIRNVGTHLICDFLKESGYTDYAKMDVHLIRSMSEILNANSSKDLTDFELFVATLWVADKIKMTPYRLDKIQYVYDVYHKE